MKILHISHHIGCMRDHAYIYNKLNFDYEFWKFPKGLFRITKEVANNIWNEKKNYFNSFDYIVTSDTAPLSRIFMENISELKPTVIVWICNRFDYNMEGDQTFYDLFRKISIDNTDKFKIIPYSDFEGVWCKLKNINHLDTITPIGINLNELEYKIDGLEELKNGYINDPNAADKYDNVEELKDKIFISIYGNENLFFKINEIFKLNNINCFNGGYKNSKDLKYSNGIVIFPDQFSKLATFETIQNEIPVFLPSEEFLIKLHPTFNNNIRYWFNSPTGNLDNNLIKYCEWYRFKDCRIYFDSIEDLIFKIKNLTPEIIKEKKEMCRKYGKEIEEKNIEMWKKIFFYNKNLIVISSAIHTNQTPLSYTERRSFFSHEQRFKQTLETIESLKKHIPDVYIVLVEGTNLIDEYKTILLSKVDYLYEAYNDPIAKENINGPNKGLGEISSILSYFESDHFNVNKNLFKSYSKISGRYKCCSNFNFQIIDDSIVAKFDFNNNHHPSKIWMSTMFYTVPKNLFNEFLEIMKLCCKNEELKECIALEHIFPIILINNGIKFYNKNDLNVDGEYGPWGGYVKH